MRYLDKFFSLPSTDRLLLVRVATLVWGIRLGLWLLPFRTLQHLLERIAQPPRGARKVCPLSPEQIAWGITVASRVVPAATCLTQALAAQVLIGRRGHPVRLRIGVAKEAGGCFVAHAWLESEGKRIFGDGVGLSRFTPLPPLDGKAR